MKMVALAKLSTRTRSTSTAIISPRNTVPAVASTSQKRLLRSTSSRAGVGEDQLVVLASPTNLVELVFWKLVQMVFSTG